MRRRGFTLVELMIGLGLALLMVIAAFEFLGIARSLFGKMKGEEVESQSAEAALDKIRIDLRRAGRGLVGPLRHAALVGLEAGGRTLAIALAEEAYELSQDLVSGQTRVPLTSTSGLSAGREICLVENGCVEVHPIAGVESSAVVLDGPLQESYSRSGARAQLIEKIVYFLDEPTGILRRKVNSGSAQPLLEDVSSVDFRYDAAANLAGAGFRLKTGKEDHYETFVFPKNIALARSSL